MKHLLVLIISFSLLAGCSSTDNSGGTGNDINQGRGTTNSNHGVSSQGSGSGVGGVENNAWRSGVGTGIMGAGTP